MTDSTFGDVIKRQSPTTLLGAAALVLVVGLAAGFGIGYKVDSVLHLRGKLPTQAVPSRASLMRYSSQLFAALPPIPPEMP